MAEYIEREALLNEIAELHMKHKLPDNEEMLFTESDIRGLVMCLPAADAAPVVHGRWIDKQEDDLTEGMWRCSACGEDFYFSEDNPSEYGANYCSACGARMDLGGADNG